MPHVDPALVERSLAASTFGSMWLDIPRPEYPPLTGPITCDLLVVGGGYTGLWTALHAAQRNPDRRIVLDRGQPDRLGGVGRNGGFVDASLTHGLQNGKTRWPNEIDTLDAMGLENLDGMQADIERLGPRRRMAAHRDAVGGHRTTSGRLAGRGRRRGGGTAARPARGARRGPFADLPGGSVQRRHLRDRPSGQAGVRTGPRLPGGRCAHLRAHQRQRAGLRAARAARRHRRRGIVTCRSAVLATNVFPSLLRRNRLYTVPVYDYVLATEPLTDAQLDRIGWRDRQGIGDCANQFHYYRLTDGQPDRVGRLRRRLPLRPQGRRRVRGPARHLPPAGGALLHHLPRSSTTSGSRHRWAGAIDTNTRFCAHWGLARDGRVAYVNGFTGLGVGAARFAADVCLDLLDGRAHRAHRTGDGAQAARCRFRPSRWPASVSRRRGGRWIGPTTRRGGATSCFARSMRWGWDSIPERTQPIVRQPF